MKFTISKEEFSLALSVVNQCVWGFSADRVILGNIFISVRDDWIYFKAVNWEVTESILFKARWIDIFDKWEVLVHAKKITSLVGMIWKDEDIEVLLLAKKLSLKTKKSDTKIAIMTGDFPSVFLENLWDDIELPLNFTESLKKTIVACHTSMSRPILTWVNISSSWSSLEFIASDTFRIAYIKLNYDWIGDFCINVPKYILADFIRAFSNVGWNSVKMSVSKDLNFIRFSINDSCFVYGALLNGNFPNIKPILPWRDELLSDDVEYKWIVKDRKELINAIKRVNVFAVEWEFSILFYFSDDVLNISTKDSKTGDVSISVPVDRIAWDLLIWVNSIFILEILEQLKSDEVVFYTKWQKLPVCIFDKNDSSFCYTVMPLRL